MPMPIVERVKAICLKPKETWQVIADERTPIPDLIKSYALPLAAVTGVAGFIGNSLVGAWYPGVGMVRSSIVGALVWGALFIGLSIAGVYLFGLIIDALAPTFGTQKNPPQALRVAIYSMTPAWAVGAVTIIPRLGVLVLLACCYSGYLLYLGLQQVMKVPADKAVPYAATAAGCGVAIGLIILLVLGPIVG